MHAVMLNLKSYWLLEPANHVHCPGAEQKDDYAPTPRKRLYGMYGPWLFDEDNFIEPEKRSARSMGCLLYTSDAADE